MEKVIEKQLIKFENTLIRKTWLWQELYTNPIEIDDGGYIGTGTLETTVHFVIRELFDRNLVEMKTEIDNLKLKSLEETNEKA